MSIYGELKLLQIKAIPATSVICRVYESLQSGRHFYKLSHLNMLFVFK